MKKARAWIWFGFLALMAVGVARLRFDIEILNLLPPQLSVAQGLKLYQQNFSDARELILTVDGPSEEAVESGCRALAEVLRGQPELVAGVTWQPPWMENPAQAAELIGSLWLNQPPAVVAELTNRLAAARLPALLAEAREQLATSFSPDEIGVRGYDPFGLTRLPASVSGAAPSFGGRGGDLFVSADGRFRLLFVEASRDLTGYRACREWLVAVRQLIAAAVRDGKIPASLRLRYTGRPAFVTEIAGGMENDMTGSVGGTLATIGVLFWLTHRRMRPLFWLLFVLLVILAGTTALGGLFLGTINVISMGFACILAGLAEDFGIVIYQESRSHPELNEQELRRLTGPGVFWSAVTTAGAFLILNLSALPGLAQLGSLVAIGIVLAAVVMLYVYLPMMLRWRREADMKGESRERFLLFTPQRLWPASWIWAVTWTVVALAVAAIAWKGLRFDRSPNVLKPRNSEANAALEEIKARFGRTQDPLWVLVPGRHEAEVSRRLAEVDAALQRAVSNGLIAGFTLPTALWPQPEHQRANRAALATLVAERDEFARAATAAGFTTNALVMTGNILQTWANALALGSSEVAWPTNAASHWILRKVVARSTNGFVALCPVQPAGDAAVTRRFAASWPKELLAEGVIVSGWELLGTTVFQMVVHELPLVLIPILGLVIVSLWLAFRSWTEVALSLVTLACGALLLTGAMALLGWEWDILNVMALPLLLGMGVDYSIHMQLGLRRHHGDLMSVRRSVGRALWLASATTVAGFGSLAFSSNVGMAGLGRVCALGIGLILLVAVWLLPVWWSATAGRTVRAGRTGHAA